MDGVIVDTAKYHYIAWKELADTLQIPFSKQDNERLKGVSRVRSFEIILEIGGRTMSDEQKAGSTAPGKITAIWNLSTGSGKMKSCPAPNSFCWKRA